MFVCFSFRSRLTRLLSLELTIWSQNRDQPEVRLSWKLVPFSSMRMSKIRHQYAIFYAILTPSWLVPRHFWSLSDICRLRRLTFCWRFVFIRSYVRKKPAVKTAGGTSQDGVLMATMRCARWHAARGHRLQRCRQRVGLLVDLFLWFGLVHSRWRKLVRWKLIR